MDRYYASKDWDDPRGTPYRFEGTRWSPGDHGTTRVFREIILEHTDHRFGKSADELSEEVYRDFGSFHGRAFHRSLAWLIEVDCIRVDQEFSLESGCMIPIYFRSRRDARVPVIVWINHCMICGMSGTKSRSHPRHDRPADEAGKRSKIPTKNVLVVPRFI